MTTKQLQARHLHVGMEIVDGGDGVRRSAHRINELSVSSSEVVVIVRDGQGFDPRTYRPRDLVRVRTDA